jgi:transcription initiation factor IIE alpha subunit
MKFKMVAIDEELHKRIKILSLESGKKIYSLIEESITILEQKYSFVKIEEKK